MKTETDITIHPRTHAQELTNDKAMVYYTIIPEAITQDFLQKQLNRMSFEQQIKINRFKSKTRQYESILGECLLAHGIYTIYGIDMKEEPRSTKKNGKPYFNNHPEIHYNISHSGDYVLCAIGSRSLGIDIQRHKPVDIKKMAKHTLSQTEYDSIKNSPTKEIDFFRYWVMKESYLKWTGEGITRDLRKLDMQGWHQFLAIDQQYSCAVWAEEHLEIVLEKVDFI